MKKLSQLQHQAIQAAKNLDWKRAIAINQEILAENANDLAARNRLGLAYLQLKKVNLAKKTFNQVLKIDKSNIIANKHLNKIKNNQVTNLSTFSNSYFIEEPGKTKIVVLHRLAGKPVIDKLSINQPCLLVPKNRYISIETKDGTYIGALPEDLSFRLTKLINRGNQYSCFIHSCNCNFCSVHIKEIKTSKKNSHLQSFPASKAALRSNLGSLKDDFVLDDDIPVQIEDNNQSEPNIEEALEKINKQG